MKILIAEDDYIISLVLENMIQKMGHEVIEVCRDGEETVKQALAKKPDCILLDYFLLGDLNGYEIIVEIRKHFQIPVVFISGHQLNLITKDRKELTDSAFISKPVLYDDLEKALTKLMS